jgi:hypothetical protein
MLSSMVSPETLRLLRWHGGLDGDALDPSSVSGASAAGAGQDVAVAACLRTFDALNHELNGLPPSTSAARDDAVPRSVAYAVAEIARMLRASGDEDGAWQVDTAWTAVLAGDIEDIPEHVRAERRGRR